MPLRPDFGLLAKSRRRSEARKERMAVAKSIKTMEDFSAFVGLSRPTVSKYFHDPSSVRKKTRDATGEALKKSGFRPNILAVNLNRRRSNIIGVVIPNSTDPFYMALTRRIELIANDAGYLAFVLSSDGRPLSACVELRPAEEETRR